MPEATSPAPAPARLRALGYARLSREGDEHSGSIASQCRAVERHAEEEGWELVGTLVDDGLTGAYERANAVEALRLLRRGDVDVILVDHSDRWSRQGPRAVADLFDVLDAVRRTRPEARFYVVQQGLDSRADTFETMFGISSVMARAERQATRRRVQKSIAERKAAGKFTGLTIPYGYRSVPHPSGSGRILAPDPVRAAVVREGVELVLAGRTLTSIAKLWNNSAELRGPSMPGVLFGADYLAGKGRGWSVSSVKAVLSGHGIVGRQTRRRVVEGSAKRDERGEVIEGTERTVVEPVSDPATGLPVTVWAPLVELDTWNRVRATLGVDLPVEQRTPRRRAARLLSGLLTCGLCEGTLHVRADRNGRDTYYCSRQRVGGAHSCTGVRISATKLDVLVEEAFLGAHGAGEHFERREYAGSEGESADLARALVDVGRAFSEPGADIPGLLARREALLTRQEELREAATERRVEVVPTGRTVAEVWEGGGLDERRELVRAAYSVLTILPGQQGSKSIDPARMVMLAAPSFVVDVDQANTFVGARAAVGVDGDAAALDDLPLTPAVRAPRVPAPIL